MGIVALGIAFKANVPPLAAETADGVLKFIVYYMALMLVGFHTAAEGKIDVDSVVNALLVGLVAGGAQQAFATDFSGYHAITETPFRGPFAYLAAMGFGVTYVRLSLRRSAGRQPSAGNSLLMWGFLCLTAIGWSRAAWMAALLVFALVSIWTGRKTFWIVSSLFLVLVLTVPVVGERVLPGGSFGYFRCDACSSDDRTLGAVGGATGARSRRTAFRARLGLHVVVDFERVIRFRGGVRPGGKRLDYPHNDFLFLFVEFGILGFGLLVAFWLHLLRKIRLSVTQPQ